MPAALSDPIGVAYVTVFLGSGLICLLLIPRVRTFDDPEIRAGLVWLLATAGAWGLLKTAYFLVPGPLREPSYLLGLVAGFATVWAWLYFCSAYTGRNLHRNKTLRRVSAAVFALVVSVKLTNPLHGLYFTTSEATAPFRHLAVNHGIIHWSSTGLSYILSAVGLFMLLELYMRSEYDTRPLAGLTVLLGLPVVFDIIALSTPRLINFIYAPIGVALFAVGVLFVFQEQLVAVSTALRGGAASVYLDGERQIRDATGAATALFPALEGATGDPLADVLPDVAACLDGGDPIFELGGGEESQYYLVEAEPVGVAGSEAQVLTFTDVTTLEQQRRQLHRRERELDEQNELYRAVLAASFAFVYRATPEGRLTFVSRSVEDALGYAPDALVGKPIDALAPTEEVTEEVRSYLDEVVSGESLQIQDLPLKHRDGRRVYTDVRVVPIYEAGVPESERTAADIVGVQGMVRETTDRHRREGLISVINRVLRHNVRNELTVINGYAEMLADDLEGESAASAEQILETTDRLLDLTESARKIEEAREASPELGSYDIIPILEEVVGQVETQYPNVSVSVDAPESAVALTLPRIETALFELLDNAAKHSVESPSVEIDVDVGSEGVTVTITDNGPGLPENERKVLATGVEDPLAHGRGLGLWLAYWIVTTLDGDIVVPNTDHGTTVELRLPKPEP
ncbi:sensor box histidine kinase [Natronomonas pharaonis DSM 2160]|uniref:histidine kinase n=1 Tax=Natronomonas pharaonis (strain ATCC 35678 / DSM 2160 / CIP 103997 / JCM 8858 / NBRC 14720 / NCIMB 2260 / Gabara) TaxID=348780 RepID=A0A1U7EXF1_NATPD|nr:ATP-binding protein [Natronomonas pharaonis]CAI49859.1 sensor box histidine kinase [Natronomonas pharaonis DSM 2160]